MPSGSSNCTSAQLASAAWVFSCTRGIRKKFAQEMGYLPPVVHIRDNLELAPARYRISESAGNPLPCPADLPTVRPPSWLPRPGYSPARWVRRRLSLFNNPKVMLLCAAVLGLLGLVPGMPNLVFLLFTAALLGLAWCPAAVEITSAGICATSPSPMVNKV
jgi:flagellar biosynthesis component FlhA